MDNNRRWECHCVCGKKSVVYQGGLTSGRSQSCGCLSLELRKLTTHTPDNFIGRAFNRLTVIREAPRVSHHRRWLCRCVCGEERTVYQIGLINGTSGSCGCLNREISRNQKSNLIHGMFGTGIYSSWQGVKTRCLNKNSAAYNNYGGRGITIDSQWMVFENFLADMGSSWKEGLTIERKDVNGGYNKENCHWIKRAQQPCNTRRTAWAVYKGQRICCADAARLSGLSYGMLQRRIKKNVPSHLLFLESRNARTH